MSIEQKPSMKKANTNLLRFRWFTCNCMQFELSNGKTIVLDPFLPSSDAEGWHFADHYCGYLPEDLGRVDYVLINHTHGDHVGSLPEVYDLFRPRILCHSACAEALSMDLDIPQTSFFPFDGNGFYQFGDFGLQTIPARHNGTARPSERPSVTEEGRFAKLNRLGTLFNTNFVIETANHIRVGICAGVLRPNEAEKNSWEGMRCNIFIRQLGGYMIRNDPEGLASEFMQTGASLLLPLHQERFYEGKLSGDLNEMTEKVNEILTAKGYAGCMLNPERGKWYTVNFGIWCENEKK